MNEKTKHLLDLALADSMLNAFETMHNQFCEEMESCVSCPLGRFCFKIELQCATQEIANKYWRAKESEGTSDEA